MVLGAIAFPVANKIVDGICKSFSGNDMEKETKRHNLAVEKVQKATAEWNKRRAEKIDFANQQFKEEQNAAVSFRNADDSLNLYNEVFAEKPQLSDFYTPSEKMKNHEYLVIVVSVCLVGVVVYFYEKNK